MDQRIKLTKKLLKNALVEILLIKPIQKVTIKEICETADVNRTTFYKYYSNEYILLKEIEQDFIEKTTRALENKNAYQGLLDILKMLKDEGNAAKVIAINSVDNSFPSKIFNNKLISELAKESYYRNKNKSKEQFDNIATFIAFGSFAVVGKWMKEDYQNTPEEIAKTIYELVNACFSV